MAQLMAQFTAVARSSYLPRRRNSSCIWEFSSNVPCISETSSVISSIATASRSAILSKTFRSASVRMMLRMKHHQYYAFISKTRLKRDGCLDLDGADEVHVHAGQSNPSVSSLHKIFKVSLKKQSLTSIDFFHWTDLGLTFLSRHSCGSLKCTWITLTQGHQIPCQKINI